MRPPTPNGRMRLAGAMGTWPATTGPSRMSQLVTDQAFQSCDRVHALAHGRCHTNRSSSFHARIGHLHWVNRRICAAGRRQLNVRVRLACSDAGRVCGMGAGGRAGDEAVCVLPVVSQTFRCLTGRWIGRSAGRVGVSTERRLYQVGRLLLRLVAGLEDWCRWRLAILRFGRPVLCSGEFPVQPRPAGHHLGRSGLGPGRRVRRRVWIALPSSLPRQDRLGALVECLGAKAPDQGRSV